MQANGMQSAGYEYILMDGGWWEGVDSGRASRNSKGDIKENAEKFGPGGIKELVAFIKNRGFKYGHYTNAGRYACNGDKAFAMGFENRDASRFVREWNIDYLKVDSCGVRPYERKRAIAKWRAALDRAGGSDVILNNCRIGCLSNEGVGVKNGDDAYVCKDFPTVRSIEEWCPAASDMHRTSNDIRPCWHSIMNNLDSLVGILAEKNDHDGNARRFWHDPDYLEVGNGGLTLNESRAQMALWSITSSPLIAGNDVRRMSRAVADILLNMRAISVNQQMGDTDSAFPFGGRFDPSDPTLVYSAASTTEIWLKTLAENTVAVVMLNRGSASAASVEVRFRDLPGICPGPHPCSKSTACTAVDVWEDASRVYEDAIRANLAPRSVAFYVLSKCALASRGTAVGASDLVPVSSSASRAYILILIVIAVTFVNVFSPARARRRHYTTVSSQENGL